MKITNYFITLLLSSLLFVSATAQQATASQDVTIIIQQERVRFISQKPVQMMQLQVFNQEGELVYVSKPMAIAEVNWPLKTDTGENLKSGLYAYSLSIQESGVTEAHVRRGHFIVDRAQDRDAKTDKLWVTSQNDGGIGTELTVARNEDSTVAGTSTTSDRTNVTSRDTTSREVAGKTDTKTASANDVPKLEAASGTVGQIAKFTSGADLGNSVMTEANGNIGVGITAPSYKLDVAGNLRAARNTSNDLVVQTTGGTNAWAQFRMQTPSQQWGLGTSQNYNGNQFYLFDATYNQTRMTIQPNAGEVAFPSPSSNHVVVRTAGGTNAWAQFRVQTPSQQWVWGTSQNYNGNQFYLQDATYNQVRMSIQPNAGEIAFPSPSSNHIVVQTSGGTNAWAQLRVQTTNQRWAIGSSQNYNGDQLYFSDATRGQIRMVIQTNGNVGIGTTDPQAKLDVVGHTKTHSLEITGGADFAENFDINAVSTEAAKLKIEAGMVVAIDPLNPGKLTLSTQAYNRRVAGIISGAGGVNPGMRMSQAGTLADGQHPVALSGRVYCWVDASLGAIEPGDFLTTSSTPGHAMKVADAAKSQGAIIGKAMTGLKAGKGLVLVLVTLQ